MKVNLLERDEGEFVGEIKVNLLERDEGKFVEIGKQI